MAATGVLRASPGQAAVPAVAQGLDYYDRLGVTKIINAAGTYTALTASIMPPQVQAEVAQARKTTASTATPTPQGFVALPCSMARH